MVAPPYPPAPAEEQEEEHRACDEDRRCERAQRDADRGPRTQSLS